MKAAIVTIGDEILIGQIIDTNSGFIAKTLDKIGVEIYEMISIQDDKQHILDTMSKLQNKVDMVIITGGLGPTKDDITKKTLCGYFEDVLVVEPNVLKHVTQLIEKVLQRPVSQINKDQALVPSKSEVLHNRLGTAPGIWMQKENTIFISLPGVPYEMKAIVEEEIVPRIITRFRRPYILHKTILTYGQGESVVAERIEEWENNLPKSIQLAYLPSPGRVRLRLSTKGLDKEVLEKALEEKTNALQVIIGDIIVGYEEDETIEVIIGKILTKHGKTLATAESCTGGKIAEVLTSVAGSSAYFRGGVVTYATDTKTGVLGVSEEDIKKHTVVSAVVAEQMAQGVQKLMKTDYAIATTGNAGPLKGDSEAGLGVVFIALATPKEVYSEEFDFGQPREKVIDRAVNKALEMLQKEILKN